MCRRLSIWARGDAMGRLLQESADLLENSNLHSGAVLLDRVHDIRTRGNTGRGGAENRVSGHHQEHRIAAGFGNANSVCLPAQARPVGEEA